MKSSYLYHLIACIKHLECSSLFSQQSSCFTFVINVLIVSQFYKSSGRRDAFYGRRRKARGRLNFRTSGGINYLHYMYKFISYNFFFLLDFSNFLCTFFLLDPDTWWLTLTAGKPRWRFSSSPGFSRKNSNYENITNSNNNSWKKDQ